MSSERRIHTRYALHLSAEIRSGARRITATTRDLSEGGCCIESAYSLGEGEDVEIALFLVVDGIEDASIPALEMGACIQWSATNDDAPLEARHLSGVRFDKATEQQTEWLAQFLAKHGG